MSYKESLDAVARPRSDKKLELVGLRTCPYELDAAAWIDDVTLWPPVEFPDIVLYLLQTPGQYTRETCSGCNIHQKFSSSDSV